MRDLKSMEDIGERLMSNDESLISAIVTGIAFRLLPNTEWNNMQAFWGVLTIYIAAFSCVHFIKAKIRQHKDNRYITLERSECRHAG